MIQNRTGFTLIELLITIPLAVVLLLAVIQTYIACGRLMDSQRIKNNLAGSVRTGMDYLTRDISMAGYGLRDCQETLAQWITWVGNVTNVFIIRNNDTTPDRVTVAGAYARVSSLAEAAGAGAAAIRVPSNTLSSFNTTNKCLIYIGRSELARITAIAGNTLSISTKPTTAGGLCWSYPSNAPIELVQVITYSVTNQVRSNYLIRSDAAVPSVYYGSYVPWDNILATDISDLQLSKTNMNVYITLKGTSAEVDRNYIDPVLHDNYRRINLSAEVFMRN